MDNAVKAIYMAAGTLIALMVLSTLVYMFRNGARLGHTYEQTQETLQVIKFNGQFDTYAKKTLQDGGMFIEKGNTASDVISCANLAMSVNEQNEFDTTNGVQVIVNCNGGATGMNGKYYVNIDSSHPKNCFVSTGGTKVSFYDFLSAYNNIKIKDFILPNYKSIGETVYEYYFDVFYSETGTGEGQGLEYSDVTGKINKIVFNIYKTQGY